MGSSSPCEDIHTGEAKQLAGNHGIQILNETDFAQLLERVDAEYDPEVLVLLHDKRKLRPKCGHEMILRTAQKRLNTGNQFWGCSDYPRCRFTMPAVGQRLQRSTRKPSGHFIDFRPGILPHLSLVFR